MTGLLVPQELAHAFGERKCILFAGAGLTRLAGGPSWTDLLVQLVDVARKESIRLDDDYARAEALATEAVEQKYALADHLSRKLIGGLLEHHLREKLGDLEPTQVHLKLAGLPWAGFITTNYDTLIEDAYKQAHDVELRVITWQDREELAHLDEFDTWVLKLHGCIGRTGTVVLDQRSLDELTTDRSATARLGNQLDRYHAVFAGYGLGDPDVLGELRRQVVAYANQAKRHFVLLPGPNYSEIWGQHLVDRYSVQSLRYDVVDHDHEPGLDAWAQQFGDSAQVDGPSNRSKLLYCLKALRGPDPGVPEVHLLVTDKVHRWGIDHEASTDSARLDKAYLLPPVNNTGKDAAAIRDEFSRFTGLPRDTIEVWPAHEFVSTKSNPALGGRLTEYTFRLIPIGIVGHDDWFAREAIDIGTRECVWKSMRQLRDHAPTVELNSDVLDELEKTYGRDLSGLPFSMTGSVLAAKDPYAARSRSYAALEWVQQAELLADILEGLPLSECAGVLDLGCGPALAAPLVSDHHELDYMGVDRSPGMMAQADALIASLDRARFMLADFRDAPPTPFDGWLAVLKNVLHLVGDLPRFLEHQMPAWGAFRATVIIETISPTPHSRLWIRALFNEMGVRHKQHFFGGSDLPDLIKDAGITIVNLTEVAQEISVEPWLASYELEPAALAAARTHIAEAPEAVVQALEIHEDDGELKMMRLQQVLEIAPA